MSAPLLPNRGTSSRRRGAHLGSLALALGFAALLAALSLVVWRQSRALETLRALEELRGERALVEAGHWELRRRIEQLESRARVEPAARKELGMHVPRGREIVILPVDGPAAPEAASRLAGAAP